MSTGSVGPAGNNGDRAAPEGESIEVPRGAVSWLYAGTVAATLAGSLFYLYLARVASLDELGAAVVLLSFAMILSTSATLGLGRGFTHFLSYHRARGEASSSGKLLRLSFVAAAVLALAAVGVTVPISGWLSVELFHSSAYSSSVALLAPLAGLVTASTILSGVLLGFQRYVGYSVVSILGNTAMYAVPIVLFSLWRSVPAIVVGWIVGAVVWVAALIIAISRIPSDARPSAPSPLAHDTSPRILLAYSLPVLASLLITTSTYYIDRLILASIANLSTVGVYNYAILFATAALFVVTPFASILTPRISALFGRGDWTSIRAVVRNSSTLVVLAFVPLALGTAALAPFLLRYIVGPGFVAASLPMAALLVIGAVFIPLNTLVPLATGIRRPSVLMVSSASALVANAALSVLLVPRIGMLGAALGNSSMFWAPFLVLQYYLRGTGVVEYDRRAIAAIWAASSAMALTIWAPLLVLGYAPVYVGLFVALGLGVFLGSMRLLRALPAEATDELIRHLPRWASPVRPLICWAAACRGCRHGAMPAPR